MAQLFADMFSGSPLAIGDSIQDLANFLEQMLANIRQFLLLVPWAAVRAAQRLNYIEQFK